LTLLRIKTPFNRLIAIATPASLDFEGTEMLRPVYWFPGLLQVREP
jgi:hypothetical protein